MKWTLLKLLAKVAPMALAACATTPQPVPPPAAAPMPAPILASAASATQPAGASDIAALIAQRAQAAPKKELKPGDLPAGHPPIASGAMPQLPKGHPSIEQLQTAAKAASTRPTGSGSVTVRAVQSTANGPKIRELPVTIEFDQGEQLLDKHEVKLDVEGTLRMDEIPLGLAVTPIIRVTYEGVEYSASGELLDAKNSDQQIQVPLYETTENAPAWTVTMQHVMLEPSAERVQVMEMLSISNPTDRAWIGKVGADNKRTTLTFALPPGAADVQFGAGFHECCVKVQDGKVIDSMALLPGITQYRLTYTLPVNSGKAEVALAAPAPVQHFMIFLPDDGSKVAAQGIADSGVADMGGGKTRYFKAENLAAGAAVKLSLSSITATSAEASAATSSRSSGSANAAKIAAAAGGLTIFVVGGMLVMFKAPRGRKP